MKKNVLKIDLNISEDKMMSGDVSIAGDVVLIAAALIEVSEKSSLFREAIKAAAAVIRINDENASQNN